MHNACIREAGSRSETDGLRVARQAGLEGHSKSNICNTRKDGSCKNVLTADRLHDDVTLTSDLMTLKP